MADLSYAKPTTRPRSDLERDTVPCPVDGRDRTVNDCLAAKCGRLLPSLECELLRPFREASRSSHGR